MTILVYFFRYSHGIVSFSHSCRLIKRLLQECYCCHSQFVLNQAECAVLASLQFLYPIFYDFKKNGILESNLFTLRRSHLTVFQYDLEYFLGVL